ncbi:MAG: trimethylamine methyltransferase family protein [Candidatus Adiutrix sp.]|nr:trimethylamine methyltransferase family protein [Candidatus Adiutrix sp.]
MQTLSPRDLDKIHQASMAILSRSGIVFNDAESVDIFRKNGVKAEGKTVFPTEAQIMKAVAQAPAGFTVKALNPAKSVKIGGPDFALLPGYGPPFVTEPGGAQRPGRFSDYEKLVRLTATSKTLNMNGFLMVEPGDCDLGAAHLDMFLCGLLGCDKPLMGTPLSRRAARDCVELLAVAFGGRDKLMDNPATVSLCNSLSPLQFSEEMASSIVELARGGQAVCVAALIMTGSSGPITIPGVLALQNAEVLTGLLLAQLVRPGAPVIYGSASSAMDIKTGALSTGAPELSMFVSLTAQIARHYRLPCRAGGGLGDALVVDAQAGAESALGLFNAVNSGINFVLHAAGMLGSYISISLEKFILDEEIAAQILRMIKPVKFNDDTLDVEAIVRVGPGGHFLTERKTFQLCRKEIHQTNLMTRVPVERWRAEGAKTTEQAAAVKVAERLAAYKAPDFDPGLRKDLLKKASTLARGAPLKMAG